MLPFITIFLQGAAIGLSAAASPGALQTYIIANALSGGWRRGAWVGLAPLISDLPIVLVILLLLDNLPQEFLRVISVLGGCYALFLAWGLLRQWRASATELPALAETSNTSLRKAVTMNFLSPGPYTFWVLINGPILLAALKQSVWLAVGFLLGFYGLFIGGNALLAVIFDQARKLGPKVVRGLLLTSIIILFGFGILLLVRGIRGFG